MSGTLLLPFEVRELLRGVTILRSALFLGNLAIVFYMLYILWSGYRERPQTASAGRAESRASSRE